MSRDYPRLTIETFGVHLLESGDLDPVYIALAGHDGVQWEDAVKYRWLVAYWCFYHCGLASWIAQHEGDEFWVAMHMAAANVAPAPTGGRFPRGHERRHFRGAQGIAAVTDLQSRYDSRPEEMVRNIAAAGHSFAAVSVAAQTHRGFGPWIGFKVADMMDRVVGHHVEFDASTIFKMFKDPTEAAIQLWRIKYCRADRLSPIMPKDLEAVLFQVVEYLKKEFDRLGQMAPPMCDRAVNIQEIETILCKWKSHMNGHYPLNNDIDEINAGLAEWAPHAPLAIDFRDGMPGEPPK